LSKLAELLFNILNISFSSFLNMISKSLIISSLNSLGISISISAIFPFHKNLLKPILYVKGLILLIHIINNIKLPAQEPFK